MFLIRRLVNSKALILHLGCVFLFAVIYWLFFGKNQLYGVADEFKPLDFWEALYFSLVTQTTVGYNLSPATDYAKLVVCVQLILIIVIISVEL